VQGYDIILGADWIYMRSPVGLDLRTREFSVTKYGHSIVTFQDETLPNHHLLIGSKKFCKMIRKKEVGAVVILNSNREPLDKESKTVRKQDIPHQIQQVLDKFQEVFQEPSSLPPIEKWIMLSP
jgi:hypothetical protein